MTPEDRILTIVYQFGKVASTSLVNTLSANPQLEVHQSHFLGEHALQRIVPLIVDSQTSDYFFNLERAQLIANLDLTHRMNRVLAGEGASRLKVISLSREPVDWLRSCILQDIAGYRQQFLEFAVRHGVDAEDEDESLQYGLTEILAHLVRMIDDKGGIETMVREFFEIGGRKMLQPYEKTVDQIVRKLFFLAHRPLVWFDEHFKPCFGLSLNELEKTGGIWMAHRPRVDFAVLRYEDLSHCLPQTYEALGLTDVGPLKRDNVSRTKPYAQPVSLAFASAEADALRARLHCSEYTRFFGYAQTMAQTGTAAE